MLNTNVRISLCYFSLKGLLSSQIYKVCPWHQLCCLFVPEKLENSRKSLLCTLGKYCCWCELGKNTEEREKEAEGRREIVCGLRHWQVQRFACLCACVYMHVYVGRCVGAEKRKGLQLKEGGEILSGKAGRRMVTDMAGKSCRWEEQYDGRLVLRCKESLQMSSQPLMLLIDQWECVLVLLYSLLEYETSNSRSVQKAFPNNCS